MAEALLSLAIAWRNEALLLDFSIFNTWVLALACLDDAGLITEYLRFRDFHQSYPVESGALLSL